MKIEDQNLETGDILPVVSKGDYMKRLVFKKWVENLLLILTAIGWFIVAAFEWNSIIPYVIGLLLMLIPSLLVGAYGKSK